MPQIIILLIGILFLGCGTELSTISKNTPPPQLKTKEIQQDIEGHYTLEKGIYSYNRNSAINKVINSSNLVIEQLDDDDYGYYFTMQVEELTPTEESGIFHKKGDEYFKRIIYSTDITKDSNISIDSNISDEHLKTEITDKVKLSQDNNSIKIGMKVGDGEVTIIWIKDINDETFRTKELQHAEHEYIKTYKERFLKYFKDT
ncbi:MAG TPA: hypothetical protein ENK88_03615 [Campylobacterales bacterium]|nr:hypothetical protein [Campylobacterales bacterium]HHD81235.1 hypothetical protein [Campylobacterales bacterium]HHH51364.1 hypothetical protein [Campylobacterales bacterium]